ncbi:MAG: ribosomal protein S18-alanine N-acetyltransferase [Furfurilactobacillus sp.]|jgi:ribosomal-protein-alanine N-acetyltransferase|uniref:[Ribosomal protein bS18]-alanine N-acetyltransferase n=1 Tax=Furfurilactobacillus milii TaxID=2888272 RepID=A0ABT6DB35_9LACO|nr:MULTISPECIES: ribosomal protein S18-alanine N-acetyltransferase [Furfurilactobacillus]QLE67132.1 Ribosomal-protein-S18p-alanine acetyltransferase [Furfurilactobacillus rossiae]MCF6161487.1 ribosomal protein S18-alanine N-acetyltransferase [Furfurilactobacillus milii]MCF6163866.1 ribosomal protein S18-alanine N-acetyltransferase [Furfurilactobacillus milii]MCF6418858.1 ribosomal protein S18-alanine N-acetyltransferase [Furfurilactobacillus milii]MCH4011330.1 ribosomal protein S18-alanine N-a
MNNQVICEPFHPQSMQRGAALIEALGEAAYPTGAPWSEPVIEENMQAPTSVYWLVRVAGQPVGFLSGTKVIDQLELTNLGIVGSWQGHGLGKQLLTTWLKRYEAGTVVTLEVRVHNEAALGLYESLDFHKLMRRPDYYDRPVEDAWIMQKKIE